VPFGGDRQSSGNGSAPGRTTAADTEAREALQSLQEHRGSGMGLGQVQPVAAGVTGKASGDGHLKRRFSSCG